MFGEIVQVCTSEDWSTVNGVFNTCSSNLHILQCNRQRCNSGTHPRKSINFHYRRLYGRGSLKPSTLNK